jgi:hypothetical protein
MSVVDSSFDNPLKPEERASLPMMGGLMNNGYQCGMIWGATLAAGAQAYRLLGPGPQAETGAVTAAQRLVESFRSRYKEIDCFEITEIEFKLSSKRRLLSQIFKFFVKHGGPIGCLRMAAGYAPVAFSEINSAFSEKRIEAPSPPVSCAAMLAQKMGVSDMHTVMAAGFAGGIGLSGGACGALGAAIWITAMNCLEDGVGDNIWQSEVFQSRAEDTIDRFMNSADFEFECSEIVGRRFENIDDHATYLWDGGCSEIIEALATPSAG